MTQLSSIGSVAAASSIIGQRCRSTITSDRTRMDSEIILAKDSASQNPIGFRLSQSSSNGSLPSTSFWATIAETASPSAQNRESFTHTSSFFRAKNPSRLCWIARRSNRLTWGCNSRGVRLVWDRVMSEREAECSVQTHFRARTLTRRPRR